MDRVQSERTDDTARRDVEEMLAAAFWGALSGTVLGIYVLLARLVASMGG